MIAALLLLLAAARMPEPLLGESITDIDGVEAGELEIDLTGLGLHRSGGGALYRSSLEAEWRALSRLGLALDLGLVTPPGAGGVSQAVSARASAAVILLHDLQRDLHVMAEASARLLEAEGPEGELEPGEGALPFSLGLRAGVRTGPVTLRGFLGAGLGAGSAHLVPVRAQAAVLRELGDGGRWGFFGLELDGDWARRSPALIAPNLVLDGTPLGVPLKLGLALPWSPMARDGEPAWGVMVRLIFEVDRD
jgi:hypothetical protein